MSTATMEAVSTKEIAKKLRKICQSGDYAKAHDELYADNAVSIEPEASHGFEKETRGIKAIKEKGKKWEEIVTEMHSTEVSEPVVADNSFAFTIMMDTTMKQGGRMKMTELCVYKVKNGKIVSEEFFM